MTLKERCQAGEAKLEQVSAALLNPSPEVIEGCEADLQEVIALLDFEPANSPALDPPVDRSELLRFRNRTHLLALQVQHAANLYQGWAQLGLSQGYTEQGRPAVPAGEPRSSYEV